MFITYQLVSGHTKFLKERLKANMILSCIEVVAWPAVVAFTVQGIIKKCVGTTCILSWVIVPLAVTIRYVLPLQFVLLSYARHFKVQI